MLGADRDVLQVRVAAAQAAGRRDRLVERRCGPGRCPGCTSVRQRVDVGALQLRQRAPVEDQARQVVGERQLLEHLDRRGRRAGRAGPLQHRQLQLLEQDVAELLRRVDVEVLAGQRDRSRRCSVASSCSICARLGAEHAAVDADAGLLQPGEDRHQRQLEIAIDARRLRRDRARARIARPAASDRSARSPAKSRSAAGGMAVNDAALAPLPQTSSAVSAL